MERQPYTRRFPIGAELRPQGGVHFRVWAPRRKRVEVVFEDGSTGQKAHALQAEPGGYFAGPVETARDGSLYRFRLDGGSLLVPDPASRFQPDGPHGPSQVIDPSRFSWTDKQWTGRGRGNEVVYELHVGTFTRAGTF